MSLRLDWATHESAKYACQNWHYSRCVPSGKLVKIGVWEDDKFIGVVIYCHGSCFNLSKPYGLSMIECCELGRIALDKHQNPVSKILSISLKFLKRFCPGIRLVVSFADPEQNHHGCIYQATNWIYTGKSSSSTCLKKGAETLHERTFGERYGSRSKETIKKNGYEIVRIEGKHRYIFPFDKEIYERVNSLSKSYPKRATSIDSDATGFQSEKGGVNPTVAVHGRK